ncbi:MAG: peptide ABC transporter substrate-binding protein [Candidatus Rokubacteria bacterium]|nr:peptide ABC transporter substrate-binding protein [Candidatus Rokubacteria bacterium]
MARRVWVLLVGLLALGATAPAVVNAQAPPGVLRVSIIGDVTLNPFTQPQQLPTTQVLKVVFSTLTRYRPGDLQAVGDLATSWQPLEGGRVWEFKLRRGVKWHDGKPFSAADVKFTLESVVNPNVKALFRSAIKGLQRVDAVDDATVRVVMERPVASLPIILAWNIPISPKHLLEGKDLNDLSDFAQKPIGTGPFRWKEAVKGSHIALEAFPDYYGGAPKLKTLVFKVIPDINTVVAQLRTGELDMAVVEDVHRETLVSTTHLGFKVTHLPSTFCIAFNNSRWPFTDRSVRHALIHGLNRELMVQRLVKGDAPLATGPYAKAFGPFYNAALKPYAYDPARARALLAEAGFKPGSDGVLASKDGKRLGFELMVDKGNPVREQVALYAQQAWKQLGIDVKLKVEEWSVYIKRGNQIPAGDYDARTTWRITPPDPDKTAEYTTGGINNHYAYANPDVDRLMAEGRTVTDQAKRVAIYHRIQEIIYQDAPHAWINNQTEILAMNKRVRDFPDLGIRDALQWMHVVSAQ